MEKRDFDDIIAQLLKKYPQKYKSYTLEEIIFFLEEYTCISHKNINAPPPDELLNNIDYAIECNNSVRYIKEIVDKYKINWDEEYEIFWQFQAYIPLSSFDEDNTLNIIRSVCEKIDEYKMADILELRLVDIYHKYFTTQNRYTYKYGYLSQWEILREMRKHIPIKTLFKMSDEEIIPVMDEILSKI